MNEFRVTIRTDGPDFAKAPDMAVAKVLRWIADTLEFNVSRAGLSDSAGNPMGDFGYVVKP